MAEVRGEKPAENTDLDLLPARLEQPGRGRAGGIGRCARARAVRAAVRRIAAPAGRHGDAARRGEAIAGPGRYPRRRYPPVCRWRRGAIPGPGGDGRIPDHPGEARLRCRGGNLGDRDPAARGVEHGGRCHRREPGRGAKTDRIAGHAQGTVAQKRSPGQREVPGRPADGAGGCPGPGRVAQSQGCPDRPERTAGQQRQRDRSGHRPVRHGTPHRSHRQRPGARQSVFGRVRQVHRGRHHH